MKLIWNIKWYMYFIYVYINRNEKLIKIKESTEVYSKTNTVTIIRCISYKRLDIKNSKYYYKKINKFMGLHYYFYKIDEVDVKPIDKKSIILFFDRVDMACDNAYILYQLMQEYENKYFVIDFKSSYYLKLKDKGFRLVDYGSEKFQKLYLSCDFILSSSFDKEIVDYNNLRNKSLHRFVFLQHGVLDKDLNNYFIDCKFDYIVCSNDLEQDIILNKHMFFKEQLLNTGLVRFSKLKNISSKYVILSYTWRGYLRDNNLNIEFGKLNKSKYVEMFDDVVYSESLKSYIKQKNLELVIILHPQFKELVDYFKSRYNDINIIVDYDYTYYINNANMLITDYSSVFNDFSYLNKPVYFYQKDYDEFYQNHIADEIIDYNQLNGIVIENIKEIKYKVKKVNEYYEFELTDFIKKINKS